MPAIKSTPKLHLPEFNVAATSDSHIQLAKLKDKNIVLFFYPKDNTPGCTRESCSFRDFHHEFEKHNTVIFGVSRDNLNSHEKFKANHSLPYELLADTEEQLCKHFDVIKMKNRYGKQVRGLERSTFLFDKLGKLQKEWRNVKVDGHVEEVLAAVKALHF